MACPFHDLASGRTRIVYRRCWLQENRRRSRSPVLGERRLRPQWVRKSVRLIEGPPCARVPVDEPAGEPVAAAARDGELAGGRVAEIGAFPAERGPALPDRAVDLVRPGTGRPVDR